MAMPHHSTAAHQEDAGGAKERLVESAIKLFSEKGYTATSIREIIEDAGVTRPVLYYYFKNKEDLFCHLVESEFDEVCAELDAIVQSDAPWDWRLKRTAVSVFERSRRSPAMVRLLMQFFFSPTVSELHLDKKTLGMERFSRFVTLMQEGIEKRLLGPVDAEILAMAFAGLVDMQVMATFDDPSASNTEALAERLVSLFLHGAANTPAEPR